MAFALAPAAPAADAAGLRCQTRAAADLRRVRRALAMFARPRSTARRKANFATSAGLSVLLIFAAWTVSFGDDSLSGSVAATANGWEPRRLDMYPEDGILKRPYKDPKNPKYAVVLHVIGIGYMFLGLNTVCDVYFTGALEVMVDQWSIKPDVAGATFMAAGGSAPELFTSLVGSTIALNDVGFGTIVGSAVFNVLFVIGLCGYVAKEDIKLTWWPLFRDCSYYIIGLSLLSYCSSDGVVRVGEAAILFCCYLIYCTIMYFNPVLEKWTDCEYLRAKREVAAKEPPQEEANQSPPQEEVLPQSAADESSIGQRLSQEGKRKSRNSASSAGGLNGQGSTASLSRQNSRARRSSSLTAEWTSRHEDRMNSLGIAAKSSEAIEEGKEEDKENEDEEEEEDKDLLERPDGAVDRILWYFSLPIYVPLYYGIPEPDETWFLATFSVSLVWIAGFSFLLVWWCEILGAVVGLRPVIMGLTVLAAGTSIPDAASSVAVAKIGEGDMAVSSSVGSNIFDILVGLPIPWMIKILIIDRRLDAEIGIRSPYITFYVLLLLCMVICVVASIHVLGWKLNKALGAWMALLYVIFIGITLFVETQEPDSIKSSNFR